MLATRSSFSTSWNHGETDAGLSLLFYVYWIQANQPRGFKEHCFFRKCLQMNPEQIKWKLLLNFYKSHALGILWLTRELPFSHSNGDLQITKYLWEMSLLPFKDNTDPWPQTMKIIRGRDAHPAKNWQWKIKPK